MQLALTKRMKKERQEQVEGKAGHMDGTGWPEIPASHVNRVRQSRELKGEVQARSMSQNHNYC